jgi:hypothetical protein
VNPMSEFTWIPFIEEKNYYDPIVETGELLCHMHCCENDRSTAGTGSVNWDEVFRALAEIRYDKWITLESFTPEIKGIAASTAIWRQLAPSADALASEGLKFLKSMQEKYFRKEVSSRPGTSSTLASLSKSGQLSEVFSDLMPRLSCNRILMPEPRTTFCQRMTPRKRSRSSA